MKKIWLIYLGLFTLLPASAWANREVTADPVYQASGDTCRPIQVTGTNGWVHISSRAVDATQPTGGASIGIMEWRERTIVNYSTSGVLFLHWNNTDYATAISSFGIVLSSMAANPGTAFVTPNNSIKVNHQDDIWGIWTTSDGLGISMLNGAGVGGQECYESGINDPKKRR